MVISLLKKINRLKSTTICPSIAQDANLELDGPCYPFLYGRIEKHRRRLQMFAPWWRGLASASISACGDPFCADARELTQRDRRRRITSQARGLQQRLLEDKRFFIGRDVKALLPFYTLLIKPFLCSKKKVCFSIHFFYV